MTTTPKTPAPESRTCAVCGQRRTQGSLLQVEDDDPESMWVCKDCQQKLALRVDDEGTKGG